MSAWGHLFTHWHFEAQCWFAPHDFNWPVSSGQFWAISLLGEPGVTQSLFSPCLPTSLPSLTLAWPLSWVPLVSPSTLLLVLPCSTSKGTSAVRRRFFFLQYRNIKFMKYQIEGSPQLPPYADHLWLWLVDSHWGQSLHIGCSKIDPILWLHPPVFRHLPTAPLLQDGGGWGGGPAHARAGEEADARWADWFTWQQFFIFVQESSWHPQVVLTCWNSSRRLSYRSRGSSLLCLISWCEYVATLATAILPSLSMFCCDPVTRLGTMRLPETCFQTFCFRPNTGLWPLAVVGGSIWVPCGSSFILHNPITMMFCSQNSYTFKSYITGRRNKLASSKLR